MTSQSKTTVQVSTIPFSKAWRSTQWAGMMTSHREVRIEKVDEKLQEPEPSLNEWIDRIRTYLSSRTSMI